MTQNLDVSQQPSGPEPSDKLDRRVLVLAGELT